MSHSIAWKLGDPTHNYLQPPKHKADYAQLKHDAALLLLQDCPTITQVEWSGHFDAHRAAHEALVRAGVNIEPSLNRHDRPRLLKAALPS